MNNADAKRLKRSRERHSQTLERYLEACHSLSLAIDVVVDRSLTTQGDTTNPASRVYPRRIIPWHDFPAQQEEIWNKLSEPSFPPKSAPAAPKSRRSVRALPLRNTSWHPPAS
ncbi:hypothetical protein F5883DRAFT_144817 [Diaporthe sp. PMI_573]|nr:hypothetical protein F5883DRAFT_144817 [Diaporthaceae sp. PMI_573]